MSWRTKNQATDTRKAITRAELEKAISEVVKASHPECQNFIGVIVEQVEPASSGASNWAIKGVKYGKANRDLCSAALTNCISEKQLEYQLSG